MAPSAFQGTGPTSGQAQQYEGIVTPEAVVLDFELAGPGSRVAAAFIDLLIRFVVIVAFTAAAFVVTSSGGVADWLGYTFIGIFLFFVTIGYSIFFETVMGGRTPGKAVFGLRVMTIEGSSIRFRHAAVRGAVALFEIYSFSGLIALLVSFFNSKSQRLGDMAAGTIVVRQRQAVKNTNSTEFTAIAGTEDFVSTLDTSRLNADEYATIRSYLLRAPKLIPKARQKLSIDLAEKYVVKTSATPPEWMSPEVFLHSVAAAYQARFRRQA